MESNIQVLAGADFMYFLISSDVTGRNAGRVDGHRWEAQYQSTHYQFPEMIG